MNRGPGLVALVALIGTTIQAEGRAPYAGRPLDAALRQLGRSRSLNIVFSSLVVRPSMKVVAEPKARSSRGILGELLAPHGLRAMAGPRRSWLVVKSPAPPPEPPEVRLSGTIKVGFRRLEDRLGLPVSAVQVRGPGGDAIVSGDGSIVIPSAAPGIYSLEALVPGFESPAVENLAVLAGETAEVVIDVTKLPEARKPEASELPPLTLVLRGGARFREAVEVSADPGLSPAGETAIPVRPLDVDTMAGAAQSVFRAVQTLPGVGGSNEFDNRLAVRGGALDQNLTVVDGVEIYNPYRSMGLASAFNPESIGAFELSTGGFDVRYGDRLSSVLVVRSRHGSETLGFRGSSFVSLLEAATTVEGRLPGRRRGSWLVSGRRTFYNSFVTARPFDVELPDFGDVQGSVSLEPRTGQRLSAHGYLSRESLDYRETEDYREDFRLGVRGRNGMAALSFESRLGQSTALRTVASVYSLQDGFVLSGDVATGARGTGSFNWPDGRIAQVHYDRQVAARDWALRQEVETRASQRHTLQMGFEAHRLRTRWAWDIGGDRIDGPADHARPIPYGVPRRSLPSFLDSAQGYARLGLWIQDRYEVSSRLVLQPGLRLDHSGINGETTLSPRATATLHLGEATRVRAAAGVYRQSPGYEKLLHSEQFVDLTEAEKLGLEGERAFHGVLGLDHDFSPGLSVRLEAYHKSFSNLIVGRLETEEERARRLAQFDFPEKLQDDLPSEAQITSIPVNGASGGAHGFDVQVLRRPVSKDTRLTGWLSYSYGLAQRQAYGRSYAFDYDRRHSLSLVGRYRFSDAWEVGATLRLASGAPWTPPARVRSADQPDLHDRDGDGNREELIPLFDSWGQLVYTLDFGGTSNLNSARLPSFARLDTRTTFRPGGSEGRWTFHLDVINILGAENAGLMGGDLVYIEGECRPTVTREPELFFPFFPYLSVRLRF